LKNLYPHRAEANASTSPPGAHSVEASLAADPEVAKAVRQPCGILCTDNRANEENPVAHVVDFQNVSTTGLESSPVAAALAGLRANEARYFKNKYDHVFSVEPAAKAKEAIDYVSRVLEQERGIVIASPPLEATSFEVDGIRMTYVFYESGLSINVMYTLADGGKRAVGFKLSDGMEVPEELASTFKFARQKSKLAGTIRGSYFVIKGEH
jgi:hypothetical protein